MIRLGYTAERYKWREYLRRLYVALIMSLPSIDFDNVYWATTLSAIALLVLVVHLVLYVVDTRARTRSARRPWLAKSTNVIPPSPYAPVRVTSVQIIPGAGTNEIRSEPPPGWIERYRYRVSLHSGTLLGCDHAFKGKNTA